MNIPLNHQKRDARTRARQDWIEERLCEARIVVADVVHHSDHLLRLACNVLVLHGETDQERKDARILLVILDARSPRRFDRPGSDREGQP